MRLKDPESKSRRSTGSRGFMLPVCIGLLALGAQVDAGVVTIQSASCSPDGDTPVRHIHLREHTDSDIRCDVQYAKPDEGGIVKTIWTARNDVGSCKTRFGKFIEKHRVKFGWQCTESAQVAELNSIPEVALEPTAEAATARNDEVPVKVIWKDAPSITDPANAIDANGSFDKSTLATYPLPDDDLVSRRVIEIATALENQKIGYKTEKLSDCSGIFHRVLANLQGQFPNIELPKPATHRSTRRLARWYHEQGLLEVVKSAKDEGDALRPGVVLFYGQQRKQYNDATPEELFTIGSGIAHMGVVVDVERVNGQVVGYSLFHGRRTGTNASITRYHRRSPSRAAHPSYGNGDEQWVAYSPILPTGIQFGEEDLIAENTEDADQIAENTEEP